VYAIWGAVIAADPRRLEWDQIPQLARMSFRTVRTDFGMKIDAKSEIQEPFSAAGWFK